MIEMEPLTASFSTVLRMAELAREKQESVHCVILGKDVVVNPGDSPHDVYRSTFPEMLSR